MGIGVRPAACPSELPHPPSHESTASQLRLHWHSFFYRWGAEKQHLVKLQDGRCRHLRLGKAG